MWRAVTHGVVDWRSMAKNMNTPQQVLSRHRLPRPYRIGLMTLWLTPIGLFLMTLLFSHGLTPALFDPRLLIPLLLMVIPALYVWREGVDVLPDGLRVNQHIPRYHAYAELDNWHYDSRPDKRVLMVWDSENHKALECRAVLTDMPRLLRALKDNLRPRNWPE